MFYKLTIFSMLLSAIAFGAGMTVDKSRIKHLTAFRLILFWSIIICSKTAEIISQNIIIKYGNYPYLKETACVIILLLGTAIIIKGKSQKAYKIEKTYPILRLFTVVYVAVNTFLITACFIVCGIYADNIVFIISLSEILFFSLGIYLRNKMKWISDYELRNWYCLSGGLIIFMMIVFLI